MGLDLGGVFSGRADRFVFRGGGHGGFPPRSQGNGRALKTRVQGTGFGLAPAGVGDHAIGDPRIGAPQGAVGVCGVRAAIYVRQLVSVGIGRTARTASRGAHHLRPQSHRLFDHSRRAALGVLGAASRHQAALAAHGRHQTGPAERSRDGPNFGLFRDRHVHSGRDGRSRLFVDQPPGPAGGPVAARLPRADLWIARVHRPGRQPRQGREHGRHLGVPQLRGRRHQSQAQFGPSTMSRPPSWSR